MIEIHGIQQFNDVGNLHDLDKIQEKHGKGSYWKNNFMVSQKMYEQNAILARKELNSLFTVYIRKPLYAILILSGKYMKRRFTLHYRSDLSHVSR